MSPQLSDQATQNASAASRPAPGVPFDERLIPDDLKELPQWVLWKYATRSGKPTKVPLQISGTLAESNNPATWCSFDEALAAHRHGGFAGVGFMFSPNDPYAGLDLDSCLNADGTLKPWAARLIGKFSDTYMEVSPSGHGIKLWCRAKLPGAGRKRTFTGGQIEVYDRGRFFTVTGRAWRGAPPQLEDHQADVEHIWEWAGRATNGTGRKYDLKDFPKIGAKTAEGDPSRHEFLKIQAARLRNLGMEYPELLVALRTINATRCDPPKPEKEVEDLARYFAGMESKPAAAAPPTPPRLVSGEEILKMSLPKTDFAVNPIISRPGLWLVNGSQKAGKTVLAAQISLSLQAPEPLMGWYPIPKACGALFIEQDDPSGLAALQLILQKTKIPLRKERFFSVDKAHFTIGPDFIDFLEHQIAEHDLGVIVLDSYTAMRGLRNSGSDIVKTESHELGLLDALAKRTGCLILVVHHASKGSASLDWSDKSAGTYAMGAHSEGQIFISRFSDLPSNAPERLVQIRGRRVEGTELVIRFDVETLSYSFVLDGSASSLYPVISQIKAAFGTDAFSPKSLFQEMGMSRPTAHRTIGKLIAGGAVRKTGYGEYSLTGGF